MAELRSSYTKEEIIEATRLLLQIRDDCVKINTDSLRKEKYKALNMAIDVLQYNGDIIFQERGTKMKIYATEMKNGKVLDKKFIGEARLLKDGNGSACIISARKYNELKRKSFSAFKKAHRGGYSIILMTEDNRKCSFGGYPLEFGYVRFE